ncbi:melanocyte-stimulating hormone receptor-like [Oculina patagonica]
MVNLTEDRTTIQELYCMPDLIDFIHKIIISSFNILLSITAFLGNIMIIVALQKPSSLHPPSKLLLGCLASTDLCVGVISQPLFAAYLMSPQHSERCHFIQIILATVGLTFYGVSLITLTAISVDRLLALMLGLRYRQVVTLRRAWIFVVTAWLSNATIAALYIYNYRILARSIGTIEVILCIITSTFCYIKIYLKLRHHQTAVDGHVPQGQPASGGIPLNIARYKKTVASAFWVQMTLLACNLPSVITSSVLTIRGIYTPTLALGWTVTLSILFLNSSTHFCTVGR